MIKYLVVLLFAAPSFAQNRSSEFRLPLIKFAISAEDVSELESLGTIVRPSMIERSVRAHHRDLQEIDSSMLKTRYGVLHEIVHYFIHRADYRSGRNRKQILDSFYVAREKAASIIGNPNPPDAAGITLIYEFLNLYYQSFSATIETDDVEIFRFVANKQRALGTSDADLRVGVTLLKQNMIYLESVINILAENRRYFLSIPALVSDSRIATLSRLIQQLESDFRNYKAEINSIILRLHEVPLN